MQRDRGKEWVARDDKRTHAGIAARLKTPHAATVVQRKAPHPAKLPEPRPPHPAKALQRQVLRAANSPVRVPTVAQRMDLPSTPKGVPIATLGNGFQVTFVKETGTIYLSNAEGLPLAHIQVAEQREADFLMMHTHTEPSAAHLGEGGKGYMKALAQSALFVLASVYSDWKWVLMVPATGAATKGVVSLLCSNLFILYDDGTPRSRMSRVKTCRELAASLREDRARLKYSLPGANSWDNIFALEMAYELTALHHMEAELRTGLSVLGTCMKSLGVIVGDGLLSGPLAWDTMGTLDAMIWWKDSVACKEGKLNFAVPMSLILKLTPLSAKAWGRLWKFWHL